MSSLPADKRLYLAEAVRFSWLDGLEQTIRLSSFQDSCRSLSLIRLQVVNHNCESTKSIPVCTASEFDQITSPELDELSRLGFDAVWLMGVWQISEGAKKISKIVSDDYEGSPYAVPDYKFNRDLGGRAASLPL